MNVLCEHALILGIYFYIYVAVAYFSGIYLSVFNSIIFKQRLLNLVRLLLSSGPCSRALVDLEMTSIECIEIKTPITLKLAPDSYVARLVTNI